MSADYDEDYDALDERLAAQSNLDYAEEKLQSLCASYAGTFVAVEKRSSQLVQVLQTLQQQLVQTQQQVEAARVVLDEEEKEADESKESSDQSSTSLAALSEQHRVRRRTLLQHSSLLELLELPNLMDACVRSQLYEEALSIAGFANTLQRRHNLSNKSDGQSNNIVASVCEQIRQRQADLQVHLLWRLKQTVTLPQCLEIVTALRRLNAIELERRRFGQTNSSAAGLSDEQQHEHLELALQLDFLEARDVWVDSPTSANAVSGQSEELLDTIERYRTRLFEVATQFNAIFRAQTHVSDTASATTLLSLWMARRKQVFLTILATQLNAVPDCGMLRDIWEASMFFASSMGRLHGDFTAQLAPLLQQKLVALVTATWDEGMTTLQETLSVCRSAGVASPLADAHVDSDAAAASLVALTQDLTQPQIPPKVLLTVPPLARLVNAVLVGLNELRRCLLPGAFGAFRQRLKESVLDRSQSALQQHERAVHAPGLRGQAADLRATSKDLQQMFTSIVVPYLLGSLEAALGNEEAAQHHHALLRQNLRPPTPEPVTERNDQEQLSENLPLGDQSGLAGNLSIETQMDDSSRSRPMSDVASVHTQPGAEDS